MDKVQEENKLINNDLIVESEYSEINLNKKKQKDKENEKKNKKDNEKRKENDNKKTLLQCIYDFFEELMSIVFDALYQAQYLITKNRKTIFWALVSVFALSNFDVLSLGQMMEDNGITNGKKSNFSNNQKGGETLEEMLQKRKAGLKSTSTASTGDAKAATGDAKAATGDAKAATGDAKAATGDAKAATSDAKAATSDAKAATSDAKAATGDAKKGDAKEKTQNQNKPPKSNAPSSSATNPGAPGSVQVINIGEEDKKPLTKKEINKQKMKDLKANLKEAKEKKANQASRREAREKKREKDKETKAKYMSGSLFERVQGYVMKGLSAVSIVLVLYGVVLFPIVICAVFLYMVLKKCFTTLMKL